MPNRCSFCGQSVSDSVQVVTGLSAHICSDCVATCGGVLEGMPASEWQTKAGDRCQFCQRGQDQVPRILSRQGADATICSECQKLCVQALQDHGRSTSEGCPIGD